ncbi:MAG: pilus assembly protein PilM [Oscillospiraceae bacterium]
MSNTKLGFDLGAYSLKMAQCGANGAERTAVAPLPENLVQDGRILSYEAMSDFLKKTVAENRLSGRRNACVVLPAGTAFLRRLTMPAMTEEQLQFNLPFEFRDYAEQGKDRFFYDYTVLSVAHDTSGKVSELELLAAAVSKETIAEYRDMFRRAGMKLKVAVPAECAYTNLLREHLAMHGKKTSPTAGHCIINLEHSATHVCIFTGSHYETSRAIDMGCADIDRAIATHCNVDEHIAQTYRKSNHENVLSQEAVQDVCGDIAVEIMKALNFYSFNNGGNAPEYIYYCGDGADIQPLIHSIALAVGTELRSIDELMPISPKVAAADAALCSLAIGITRQ